MNSHRIKTALTENGKLSLQNLPFKKGDKVEIIILPQTKSTLNVANYPLANTVIRYDDPFESAISPEDWNANN